MAVRQITMRARRPPCSASTLWAKSYRQPPHAAKDAEIRADRLRGEPRAGGPQGARAAGQALRQRHAVEGRRRGGARRRRPDAPHLAPGHEGRPADLRHAPRHHRLPDERVSREGPARAAAGGADHRHPSAGDARPRHQGQAARALRHQRGLAVSPDLSGGAAVDLRSTARSGCRS